MIFQLISFSAPLLLISTGALFTEYTGSLALYMEGLVTFSAFLMYSLTLLTNNFIVASILTTLISCLIIFLISLLLEKTKANTFVAAIAMNLFFQGLTSFLSARIFNTSGVLSSKEYFFSKNFTTVWSISLTLILLFVGFYLLFFTQKGVYFRTTGTNKTVLIVKGVNPYIYKTASWTISALFAAQGGILLTMRISSFVPNISSGRGWMALAAVYLGKGRLCRMILFILIFCAADYLSAFAPGILPAVPSTLWLSLPYLTVLVLSLI